MSIIKKFFAKKKTEEELKAERKAEVLQKATEFINTSSENSEEQKQAVKIVKPVLGDVEKVTKKNIRALLLELADSGDAGALAASISDKAGITQVEAATALAFITKNNYAEAVNSPGGKKYYLNDAGRKFCISKEFNSIS